MYIVSEASLVSLTSTLDKEILRQGMGGSVQDKTTSVVNIQLSPKHLFRGSVLHIGLTKRPIQQISPEQRNSLHL